MKVKNVIENGGMYKTSEIIREIGLNEKELNQLAKAFAEKANRDFQVISEDTISFKIRRQCAICDISMKLTGEEDTWWKCNNCKSSFCPKCYKEKILPTILVDFGECPKCLASDHQIEEVKQ